MTERFSYLTCCVHELDGDVINAMRDTARSIELSTFKRRCDWREWARGLGYGPDFPIERDWHVRYYKGRWRGQPCYFAVHSAIEHIFTLQPGARAPFRRPW